MTDGSSLEATQPSFSLAQGQCFAYYCRVSWKFVAGPCLRHFMQQQRLRNEPIIVALLFSRVEIILFSTDSLTEVRHLLTWGKAENHGSVRGTMILFQTVRDWNPFDNASKRAHNLMPLFMKGLQSTHLPCRPSQVLSGRSSIGKKTRLTNLPHLKLHNLSFFTPEISPAQGQRFDSCKVRPQWNRWDSKWNCEKASCGR